MPILRSGADAVVVTEVEVETAALKHCKGIISRAGDVIVRPVLPIPIGRRVDQHEQALRPIERAVRTPVLGTEIYRRLRRHIALFENGVELARVVRFEKDVVMIEIKARAAAFNAPGQRGEPALRNFSRFDGPYCLTTQLPGGKRVGIAIKDDCLLYTSPSPRD